MGYYSSEQCFQFFLFIQQFFCFLLRNLHCLIDLLFGKLRLISLQKAFRQLYIKLHLKGITVFQLDPVVFQCDFHRLQETIRIHIRFDFVEIADTRSCIAFCVLRNPIQAGD